MAKVLCQSCEYYWAYGEDNAEICLLKDTDISAFDEVCENFLLNIGLHTTRTIPEHCINYKK